MDENRYLSELNSIENERLEKLSRKLYERYNSALMTNSFEKKVKPLADQLRFLYNDDLINYRELCNNLIRTYYPNEAVVKSQFVKNVLSKNDNHTVIYELNSNSSRLDLCKINHTSIAYEIKTEYDNYSRLEKQIEDYLSLFEKAYIIIPRVNYSKLVNIIPESCGIYTYSQDVNRDYKFRAQRKAIKSNKLSAIKQLETLTKEELKRNFKIAVLNDRKKIMDTILENYSPRNINKTFKNVVKTKYNVNWNYLLSIMNKIYELDYQWFYKNNIDPKIIYQTKET